MDIGFSIDGVLLKRPLYKFFLSILSLENMSRTVKLPEGRVPKVLASGAQFGFIEQDTLNHIGTYNML